jgi:hypothetical protein
LEIRSLNDPAALFVDHLLPQAMAGLGIDLVEVRLFECEMTGKSSPRARSSNRGIGC